MKQKLKDIIWTCFLISEKQDEQFSKQYLADLITNAISKLLNNDDSMQITLTENIIAILAKLRQDQANILLEIKEIHGALDPLLDLDGVRQLNILSSRYISIEEECRIINTLIKLK